MVAVVLVGAAASRAADVAETETFAANDVGTRIVTFVQRSGVAGFSCEVRRYPDHDACVFVLANRDTAPVRQVADATPLPLEPAESGLVERITVADREFRRVR